MAEPTVLESNLSDNTFSDTNFSESNLSDLKLPPLKKPHERKTFATNTLKLVHSRLQYYRKKLKQPIPTDEKKLIKYRRIQNKYEQNLKVRNLLKKAVANLYI